MTTETKDFFWPSYVDLLTALFIVMLVLFVLSYKLLSDSEKITRDKLKKIEEVQKAAASLDSNYFSYNTMYKRYELKKQIQFASDSYFFQNDEQRVYAEKIGKSIKSMLDSLSNNPLYNGIKYLLVIEGMASKNDGGTEQHNYNLSYERARTISTTWEKAGINIDNTVCEKMISGSGWGGVGRYKNPFENKNRRILIQIIPKLSKFDKNES